MDRVLASQLEVIASAKAQQYAADNLSILNDIDGPRNWQPSDFLPDLTKENDALLKARTQAQALPLPVLVVLIGDMITEEGLPTYMSQLNRVPAMNDTTGVDQTPFAKWVRGWTAEENRHGDLLNGLLRINPNVQMRSVEQTVQHLINEGFDVRTYSRPYETVYYTTFQEWATMLSHKNVAQLALEAGDELTTKVCRRIAGDEARHERFYGGLAQVLLDEDPNGMVLATHRMVEAGIVMPAERMKENAKVDEGNERKLFDSFARVAARLGVYTPVHYVQRVQELVEKWNIAALSVQGEAEKAQEALCRYASEKRLRVAEKMTARLAKAAPEPFEWIYGNLA